MSERTIATAPLDPTAVPDALQSRTQYLLWDCSADAPRRPHWEGDFHVSWSDPDEWHSFGEAVATADQRDSWGVGYVTAVNNDDHPTGVIAVIDVDGGADESDELKDWVPDIQPFIERDCYVEWSPSHAEPGDSGLHIPVVGTDVPEWFSDTHLTDEEHEGVDLLTNKFCTVTGDRVDGAGDNLAKWSDEWIQDWLADAYENLTGEDPRTTNTRTNGSEKHQSRDATPGVDARTNGSQTTGQGGYDEWLDADLAREALDKIDADVSYPVWRNIGFALADAFTTSTAKQLFENWSRDGTKWDSQAANLADRIIEDANTGDVSPATLVYHAKQAGWEPPSRAPSTEELLDEHSGTDNEMPFWLVRQAAVEFGVLPADAFVEREGDDGGTYQGFPGPETYNNALEAIEDAGFQHGRAYMDTGPTNPVYDVVDDQDIELHLVPLNGQEVRVTVKQNGEREYTEKQSRGFWDNATKRARIAGRIADGLGGVSESAVKDGVKNALTTASIDSDERDDWEDKMRSPREQDLRNRTQEVVCYPAADSVEYVVTMEPGSDSPATEPQTLRFDEGDLIDMSASTFRSAHITKFHTKTAIDAEEWGNLTDYWLEIQDIRDRDPDHETEAAIEKFVDWVDTMKVWSDESGFAWQNRNGYYDEDHQDGEDVILVPGQKVVDWQRREDASDVNLSQELRERGVLLGAPSRETIAGDRRRAWPVKADETSHTPESALVEVDENDEEAPEGLR